MKRWTVEELARMIDHVYVKADAIRKQMEKLCKEAREYRSAMAAISSSQTALCVECLRDSDIHMRAVIGFPLGQTIIAAKVFEVEDAIQNGADETNYMINLTKVKAGNWEYVKEEMQQIVAVCRSNERLYKVILETCYLTKDEVKQMCKIATAVKPDFVKTSTGFENAGATVEDVALMHRCADTAVKAKASGGIQDARTLKKMISGETLRIGTNAGVSIVRELQTEVFKHSGYVAIPEEYQYPYGSIIQAQLSSVIKQQATMKKI